jgi:predicted amidohydrolase
MGSAWDFSNEIYHCGVSSTPFTIGLIQDHATADVRANLERATRLVREAAGRGAQIICLKELFNALYFCKSQQCDRFDLAEAIPGPTTDAMQALARELAVVLIVPIFERQAAGIYRNSAAIIDADGSLLACIARCTSPTTRCSTRSTTSPPATVTSTITASGPAKPTASRSGRRATPPSAC